MTMQEKTANPSPELTVQEVQQEQKTLRQDDARDVRLFWNRICQRPGLRLKINRHTRKAAFRLMQSPPAKGLPERRKHRQREKRPMRPRRKEERKSGFGLRKRRRNRPPGSGIRYSAPSSRRTISCTGSLQRPTRMTTLRQAQRLQGDELGTSALQLGEHAYHAHKLRPLRRVQKGGNKGWTKPTFGISRPGNAPKIRRRPAILCPAGAKADHPQGVCRAESRRVFPRGERLPARKDRAQNRQCHGKAG